MSKKTDNKDLKKCSFCGRTSEEVNILITGKDDNTFICSDCAEHIHEMINSQMNMFNQLNNSETKVEDKTLNPHEIVAFLNDYVIGQDVAKKKLAVAVFNHYKRINQEIKDDIEIEKSNILLCGNSGTGKTFLARTLSKILNVPFTQVDATVLTEAGYVGEDVESILTRLLMAADYDVERAERGIVYIDEIDKIARKGDNPSITRDVSGEGVQQGLLKLLEGSKVMVPPQGGRKHPDQKMIEIDTTNILFICGGAFEGIEKKIAQRFNSNAVGFSTDKKKTVAKREHILKYATHTDFRSFGLIPEILGRLPIIATLNPLDKEALRKILTEPKNALVKQYISLLKMDGINLTFSDDVYDYIVDLAYKNKLGARALRGIMEQIMVDVMYDAPLSKKKKINITLDYAKEKCKDIDIEDSELKLIA